VPSKALVFLATIPLIVQFAGCASSPAQTGAKSARTVVQFEEKKSALQSCNRRKVSLST
jgi:hypothetical protein